MNTSDKIYVAGHNGLVGSAIIRRLKRSGYNSIVGRSSTELDLRMKEDVQSFFNKEKPDYVFLAAAKVGGINANNKYPADFIYQNLEIQNNVIQAAYRQGVKKLIFLGSSCIYPRECMQPIKEEYLLSGHLEPTNEAYAVAKIAGIKMCQSFNKQYNTNFISVMPTNLYGPNDNFDIESSHVLPAMLSKFHQAKVNGLSFVELWGDGSPKREFLYVDDMAEACIFLMNNYDSGEIVNIGTGKDITIKELADNIKAITGYDGEIRWNKEMPNGTPRKLLDVGKLTNLGWRYKTELYEGITKTYDWYKNNIGLER